MLNSYDALISILILSISILVVQNPKPETRDPKAVPMEDADAAAAVQPAAHRRAAQPEPAARKRPGHQGRRRLGPRPDRPRADEVEPRHPDKPPAQSHPQSASKEAQEAG